MAVPNVISAQVVVALLLRLAALALAEDSPSVTTAPIFLPYWDEEAWSIVRGSIIDSNETASETTYTIFCPTETPPACDLSLEFPFVVVEGPDSIGFHGTYTSTFIANVECDLDGTTQAVCSGYSSYKSGYANAFHTGPTEVSWTKTLSASDVEWGILTMTDKPDKVSDKLGVTNSPVVPPTVTGPSDMFFFPSQTDDAEGTAGTVNGKPALAIALFFASFALVAVL